MTPDVTVVIALTLVAGATAAIFLGVAGRDRSRTTGVIIAMSVAIAAAVLAYARRAPDVSVGRALAGALVAAAGLVLPFVGYYQLGARVKRLRTIALIAVVSLVPLCYFLLALELVVTGLARCPEGAYECPY